MGVRKLRPESRPKLRPELRGGGGGATRLRVLVEELLHLGAEEQRRGEREAPQPHAQCVLVGAVDVVVVQPVSYTHLTLPTILLV